MFWIIPAIIFVTAISVVSLLFIIVSTSPTTLEGQLISINIFYFFLSLFAGLAGVVTLVLYWLSSLRLKLERKSSIEAVHLPKALLRRSARQALLFSGVITAIWILNTLNFVNPLNIILIISAAILIEIYFFGH